MWSGGQPDNGGGSHDCVLVAGFPIYAFFVLTWDQICGFLLQELGEKQI